MLIKPGFPNKQITVSTHSLNSFLSTNFLSFQIIQVSLKSGFAVIDLRDISFEAFCIALSMSEEQSEAVEGSLYSNNRSNSA